jgi:hypothetical protein
LISRRLRATLHFCLAAPQLLQFSACYRKLLRRIVRPRRIASAATVSGVRRADIWAGPHCSAPPAASSQAMLTSRHEVQLARQLTEVAVANRKLSIVRCASARPGNSVARQLHISVSRIARPRRTSRVCVAIQRRVSASHSSVASQRRSSCIAHCVGIARRHCA